MFKQIEDFNYSINECGVVMNDKFNRPIKPYNNGNGYYAVDLFKNGKSNVRLLHRLLMTYFSDDDPKEEINHIDGNPANNRLDNLEWCTRAENQKHRYHILMTGAKRDTSNGRFTKGEFPNVGD